MGAALTRMANTSLPSNSTIAISSSLHRIVAHLVPELSILENSSRYFSAVLVLSSSKTPLLSTPTTIIPPLVFAKALYVSQKVFGNPFLPLLNSYQIPSGINTL